jgi:hypothetical protein
MILCQDGHPVNPNPVSVCVGAQRLRLRKSGLTRNKTLIIFYGRVSVAVLIDRQSVNPFKHYISEPYCLFLLATRDRTPMGSFMSTLAEISGIPFILCLILGAAKHFAMSFSEREWSTHLPDFIELMVMWAVYVWLSNLFSSRIFHIDESDAINLLAIFLVCLSVALFRGKDDQAFYP